MMESITVECHAGARADEYPLRFFVGRRKIEVTAIVKRWHTPEASYFKVSGDDGWSYLLEYNTDKETWRLMTLERP